MGKPFLRDAILAELRKAPCGLHATAIASAVGRESKAVSKCLSEMHQAGLTAWLLDPCQQSSRRVRHCVPEHLETTRAAVKYKPKRALRPDRKPSILKPRIQWDGVVDISRAKVTICPAVKDHRFTVTDPEPVFSALGVGRYL